MENLVRNGLRYAALVIVSCFMAGTVVAESSAELPHSVVAQATGQVLSVVESKGALLERDPEAFYREIGTILEPVVAFDYIAYGVMGSFAKQASAAQRRRFSEVFQTSMITTYAKGMAVYANQEIEIVPPEQDYSEQRKASVVQKLRGDGSVHTVVYSMGKSKRDNQWKLLNVIIDGVNLGTTFRAQFAQAMKKHADIDQVIANWSA